MSRSSRPAAHRSKELSSRKRLFFRLMVIIGALVFLEVSCLLILVFRYGSPSSLRSTRAQTASSTPEAQKAERVFPVVLHPYQGAVIRPIPSETSDDISLSASASEYGFPGMVSPIHTRSEDSVLVGILGGSVARQFTEDAASVLQRELTRIPRFKQRSVTVIPLAIDGYKQPQQLMTMSYLMTLGAEFDIVINLDGLNEAALPAIDNVPTGVFAAFPRQWESLISMADSIEMKRRIGYVTYLRLRDKNEARFFDSWPLRYSSTATLIWQIRYARNSHRIMEQLDAIRRLSKTEKSYCASGPPQQFDNSRQMYDHCIDIWYRSSILLNSLCAGNGTRYFHFLQPNQYLAGSKPMLPSERTHMVRESSDFRDPVVHCYPVMRSRGQQLNAAGVHFTDLTQVFSEIEEPTYVDDCCHMNHRGHTMIAEAIANAIVTSFNGE